MKGMRHGIKILLAGLLLSVTGCRTIEGLWRPGGSERLLEAESRVDTAAGDMDPLARHMKARVQVDPDDFQKTAQYTTHGPPREETRVRVLPAEEEPAAADVLPVRASPLPAAAPAPSLALGAGPSVLDVRTGEHPGKTRLVLDLDAEAAFDYAVDNSRNVLTVTLRGADWRAPPQRMFSGSPLLDGYAVRQGTAGEALLEIRLKGPARVALATAYKADQGKGPRIVFDLVPP